MSGWLITGAGMLGQALAAEAQKRGIDAILASRAQFDLREAELTRDFIRRARPQLIFHTAALTKVNYCEQNPAEAMQINGEGTAAVAGAAADIGAGVIYFSTDYVLDGSSGAAQDEDSQPNPLNQYGRSKLVGEHALAELEQACIVRTSGVFGQRSDRSEMNFFRAIYAQLQQGGSPVKVVADQYTCVSYAPQLAALVCELSTKGQLPRLSHITSDGVDSWAGWARQLAELGGYPSAQIEEISSAERFGDAPRPRISVLSTKNPQIQALVKSSPAAAGIADYVRRLTAGLV